MDQSQNVDGLVIVTAQILDSALREEFWDHMESLVGERLNDSTFEFTTSDWDDGLWDDEVNWLTEFFEGTGESIVAWRFSGDRVNRYVLGSN